MDNNIYKKIDKHRSIYYGWATAMHTRLDLILCNRPQEECERAAKATVQELQRLEKRLNRFNPTSDISRINSRADKEPVVLDEEMWNILTIALNYGMKTQHLFDITANSRNKSTPPGRRIFMDPDKKVILFKSKEIEIDLGGFAKGYGIEIVQNRLIAEGWNDYLINFGNSSVCARGNRPGGEGWNVGVENITKPGSNVLEITLRNQALNTSGNTVAHTKHIYSQKTGGYVDSIGSVSVTSDQPLEGEVLSTAIFSACNHPEEGQTLEFIKKIPGIRAYAVNYQPETHTIRVLF